MNRLTSIEHEWKKSLMHVIEEHNYIGHVRPRNLPAETELILACPPPVSVKPKCRHEWPEKGGQTDIHGFCVKCGTSFQHYIHMECL